MNERLLVEVVRADEVEIGDTLLVRDYYDKDGFIRAYGSFTVESIPPLALPDEGKILFCFSRGRGTTVLRTEPVLRIVPASAEPPVYENEHAALRWNVQALRTLEADIYPTRPTEAIGVLGFSRWRACSHQRCGPRWPHGEPAND